MVTVCGVAKHNLHSTPTAVTKSAVLPVCGRTAAVGVNRCGVRGHSQAWNPHWPAWRAVRASPLTTRRAGRGARSLEHAQTLRPLDTCHSRDYLDHRQTTEKKMGQPHSEQQAGSCTHLNTRRQTLIHWAHAAAGTVWTIDKQQKKNGAAALT